MIRRYLSAYTPPGGSYPPYISINETDQGVSVAIREPATSPTAPGPYAGIVLETSIAVRLLEEALAKLRTKG